MAGDKANVADAVAAGVVATKRGTGAPGEDDPFDLAGFASLFGASDFADLSALIGALAMFQERAGGGPAARAHDALPAGAALHAAGGDASDGLAGHASAASLLDEPIPSTTLSVTELVAAAALLPVNAKPAWRSSFMEGDFLLYVHSAKGLKAWDGEGPGPGPGGLAFDGFGIDADATAPGEQGFRLVRSFSGAAGEAVMEYDPAAKLSRIFVDADGDAIADMALDFSGRLADLILDTGPVL